MFLILMHLPVFFTVMLVFCHFTIYNFHAKEKKTTLFSQTYLQLPQLPVTDRRKFRLTDVHFVINLHKFPDFSFTLRNNVIQRRVTSLMVVESKSFTLQFVSINQKIFKLFLYFFNFHLELIIGRQSMSTRQ